MTPNMSGSLESIIFSMRKAYQRLVRARPSFYLLAIIVSAISIFFFGGGIYDLLVRPPPALSSSGTTFFYYPGLQGQLLPESLVAMFLFAVGFIGFFVIYMSTKYAYKPRQAFLLLMCGAVFIIIAYVFAELLLLLKLSVH
jgi:hypothetical protein